MVLAVAIAVGGMIYASGAPRSDPLTGLERAYVLGASLPTVVALVVPTLLALAGRGPLLAGVLPNAGMALSGLQVMAGIPLVVARHHRGARMDRRLLAAIALASIPLLLLVFVDVLLGLG